MTEELKWVVSPRPLGHPLGAIWLDVLFAEEHKSGGTYEQFEAERLARSLQAEAIEKAVKAFPAANDFPKFVAEQLPF